MWDTLAEPWKVCLTLAWESFCEGSVPIGSVITGAGGRILAAGRNRRAADPAGEPGQISGSLLAHAEVNALLRLDLESTDVRSCELYSAVEPCPLCIGAICMAGIKVVRYAARDTWAGSTNLLGASPYLVGKAIRSFPPEDARLETAVQMLQTVAAMNSPHPRWPEVLAAWSRRNPENIALGRRLHACGDLQRMRNEGAAAPQMVALLDRLIGEWGRGLAGGTAAERVTLLSVDETWRPRLAAEWGEKAARHVHFGDGLTVVALDGGRIVGLLSAYTRPLPPPLAAASETYIDFLEVRPEFRRRGIASRLAATAIEHARSRGHYQVRTWSSEDKAEAIPLWHSLGFGLHPAVTYPAAANGREIRGLFATRPVGPARRQTSDGGDTAGG